MRLLKVQIALRRWCGDHVHFVSHVSRSVQSRESDLYFVYPSVAMIW